MIHLVTVGDDAYVAGLCITIASSLHSLACSDPVTFHVLDGGLTPSSTAQLKELCNRVHPQCTLVFHRINQQKFQSLRPCSNGSRMTYARLFMGSLIEASKVIYLDSDMIILGDLNKLWNAPMNSMIVLGCRGGESAVLQGDCPWQLLPEEENLPYINGGMIVFDLDQWRLQNIEQQILALTANSAVVYRCYDQTILNYLLRHHIGLLPMTWNWQGRITAIEQASSVNVIHFITPKKPWFWWSGDVRFKLWRYCYRTFAGSPLKLFLQQGAWSGLLYGIFETAMRRYPFLRWIYVQFLSLSYDLRKNGPAAKSIATIKEYYTTGLGGKQGAAEFEKIKPAFKILVDRFRG